MTHPNKTHTAILDVIIKHEGSKTDQIAIEVDRSVATVRKYLKEMIAAGMVRHSSGYYFPVSQKPEPILPAAYQPGFAPEYVTCGRCGLTGECACHPHVTPAVHTADCAVCGKPVATAQPSAKAIVWCTDCLPETSEPMTDPNACDGNPPCGECSECYADHLDSTGQTPWSKVPEVSALGNANRDRILGIMRNVYRATVRQVAERAECSTTTARSHLDALTAEGKLHKTVESKADHVVSSSGKRQGWLDRNENVYRFVEPSEPSKPMTRNEMMLTVALGKAADHFKREREQSAPIAESPVTCEHCTRKHKGGMVKSCGTVGCECYCNRAYVVTTATGQKFEMTSKACDACTDRERTGRAYFNLDCQHCNSVRIEYGMDAFLPVESADTCPETMSADLSALLGAERYETVSRYMAEHGHDDIWDAVRAMIDHHEGK